MDFQTIFKQRRKHLGLTLKDVANKMGVTEATVQRWESGNIKSLRHYRISKLSEVLEISPSVLMGWESEQHEWDNPTIEVNNVAPPPQLVPKPRLGTIACGTPILAEENHETTDFVPADIKCDFTLECKGDSMVDARIHDGDIVYIRSQPTVENGEIAAVLVNSNEATLKRVFIYNNKVMLQPANSNYEPLVFVNEEINQIKIIGKAVGFTSKLK